MTLQIAIGDLDASDVRELLALHAQGMLQNSPPESTHFLDVSALQAADVTFWTARDDAALAGCGALKELDARHGEIKSMRTHPDRLRQGVAAALLAAILTEARSRGYHRVSLETGSGTQFEAAGRLYAAHGFTDTGPFADYRPGPFSRFMTLRL